MCFMNSDLSLLKFSPQSGQTRGLESVCILVCAMYEHLEIRGEILTRLLTSTY